MTYRANHRFAYDCIRPVMLSRKKKQWLLQKHIHETTPPAAQAAAKPNPWPVVLILITGLLAMGALFWPNL
jgi:hypothetical protein